MVNGPPKVDDLESLVDKLLGFFGREMLVDTSNGGITGLINMYTLDGLAFLRRVVFLAWTASSDSYKKMVRMGG